MRVGIPGLATAYPLGESLPPVYHDAEFVQRLTAAFDEVLAPILMTLDCFDSYLDPHLAPLDVLEYLARWVALPSDDPEPPTDRRRLVAEAVEMYRWRGTRHGLAARLALLTSAEIEVLDSGGCTWSVDPGGPLPGEANPWVEVRVRTSTPSTVDFARLAAAVADTVPAHVTPRVRAVGVSRITQP